jgi:hypothetical protein
MSRKWARCEHCAAMRSCTLCAGTGWAAFPDPFMKDGSLIEGRCPACQDTTVRAPKRRRRRIRWPAR